METFLNAFVSVIVADSPPVIDDDVILHIKASTLRKTFHEVFAAGHEAGRRTDYQNAATLKSILDYCQPGKN